MRNGSMKCSYHTVAYQPIEIAHIVFLNMSPKVLSNQDTVYCITIITGIGDDRWRIILTSDGICGILGV